MTKEQAVEILKSRKEEFAEYKAFAEALEIAIESLEDSKNDKDK